MELVAERKKNGIKKAYANGTIALYKDGEIQRILTYNSNTNRKEIIERWLRETRNLNNIHYTINPDL